MTYTEFIRPFPDEEGLWTLVRTGETARCVEQKDIQGDPIFAIWFDKEGPFYSVDMEGEAFEKQL